MPLVEVTLTQGRSPAQLRALIHELHEAVVRAVDAPAAAVRVVVREIPPAHWASGDVTIEERRTAAAQGSASQGSATRGSDGQKP
jgi:4-oxalocrotonate tautomerase